MVRLEAVGSILTIDAPEVFVIIPFSDVSLVIPSYTVFVQSCHQGHFMLLAFAFALQQLVDILGPKDVNKIKQRCLPRIS